MLNRIDSTNATNNIQIDTIALRDTILLPIDSFLCNYNSDIYEKSSFLITKDGNIHFEIIGRDWLNSIQPKHVIGVSIDIWTNKEETNSDFGALSWGFWQLDTILNGDYVFKGFHVDLPDDFCPL